MKVHDTAHVRRILKVMSFATGLKTSLKSTPAIWLYPHATNLARNLPSLLMSNTHLCLTHLRPGGISFLLILIHTVLSFIFLNSFKIAALHNFLWIGSCSCYYLFFLFYWLCLKLYLLSALPLTHTLYFSHNLMLRFQGKLWAFSAFSIYP